VTAGALIAVFKFPFGLLLFLAVVAWLAHDFIPPSKYIAKWRTVIGCWSRARERWRVLRALNVLERALDQQDGPPISNPDELRRWISEVRRTTEADADADLKASSDFVMNRVPRPLR
jgi:hypothetical protein